MIGLLRQLDELEGEVEADLQEHYGIDYRDRFRIDPDTGRPVLTLRRLCVLVTSIAPNRSRVAAASLGYEPWSREASMLDELRRTQLATHGVKNPKPHPDRARRTAVDDAAIARRRRLNQERAAHRRRQLEAMGNG
jgi:hypothetical protein